MKRCSILFILLVLGFTTTLAQDTRVLTLNEAIQLSLQNSKQLKLEQAKIKEATAGLQQARDNKLPDVSATGSYLRLDDPKVDLKLKLGGPQQENSAANPLSNIKINSLAYGLATASLPLFSGFRIHYGIEAQKYLLQAAHLDADKNKEDVIANTILAYSNLYKAQLSINIIQEYIKEAQSRVTDFVNLEKNGTLVHNDVLKAQLQVSNLQLSLMDASKNYDMATLNMNLMLGLPDSLILATDSNSFHSLSDTGNISDWVQNALQNRKDITALSIREKAANINIKAIKGEYYPGIALTGNYIAADIPNLLTVDNALGIGLGLKYNLSSLWKTNAKVMQARAQQEQLVINQEMLSDNVQIQVTQAYKDYVISLQKINVYESALQEAYENYKITQSKYYNKVVSSTDLLDADNAQIQARLNCVFSKVDAAVAYYKLLENAGLLANNLNIQSK